MIYEAKWHDLDASDAWADALLRGSRGGALLRARRLVRQAMHCARRCRQSRGAVPLAAATAVVGLIAFPILQPSWVW
jgi:hypothetical protein